MTQPITRNLSDLPPDQQLRLYEAQHQVMALVMRDLPLPHVMRALCLHIENIMLPQRVFCSILLLDNNQLRHCAAPSLPADYCAAIDGLGIGPAVGSCGTALYKGEQVIVSDINSSPLWENYKHIALRHGLQACWSTPVFASGGQALASFAVYQQQPRAPSDDDLLLINSFTQLAGLIIERQLLASSQHALTEQLHQANARLSALVAVIPDLGIVLDHQGTYVDFFGNTRLLQPNTPAKLIGKNLRDILSPATAEKVFEVMHKTLYNGKTQVLEYVVGDGEAQRTFEGRTASLDACAIDTHLSPGMDRPRYLLWMTRDISVRKAAEQQLLQMARFDPLTNLPNRRQLEDALAQLLAKAARAEKFGALLFIDLDNFKQINDTLGHAIGDHLLQQVAERLRSCIRRNEMIARIGGDEFILLLDLLEQDETAITDEATQIAHRIISCLSEPILYGDGQFPIHPSIGISLIAPQDLRPHDIIKRADTAMYQAKTNGGNRMVVFTS